MTIKQKSQSQNKTWRKMKLGTANLKYGITY